MLDQDPLQLQLSALILSQDGHHVNPTVDPEAALAMLRSPGIDIVILETAQADDDGERLCRKMRQLGGQVPIMIVSERDRSEQIVRGLDVADDYITKPFSPRELLARVRALLRRAGRGRAQAPDGEHLDQEVLTVGEIRLSLNQMHAIVNGHQVPLTRREFGLMYALMRNPRHVLSRGQLIRQAWGDDFIGSPKVVDVYVQRLRKKLAAHLPGSSYIETLRGFGYRFQPTR